MKKCDYCEEKFKRKELKRWIQDWKIWRICEDCAEPSNWEQGYI